MIKPYSVPLLFAHEQAPKSLWCCGGTALLWQSLEGKFIVSGAHVWRELVKQRDQLRGRMSIFIGMAPKVVSLLEVEPVSIDDELDIVVLPAPGITDDRLGKKKFYQTRAWPLAPAIHGETLGTLGFPGEAREPRQFTVETNSFYYENSCAVSTSGANLLIGAFSSEPPMTVVHVNRATKPIANFGGISGAPVFALRAGKPIWVGVIKRGSAGRGIDAGLQATPSHFVQADGTIRRN